MNPDKVPKLTRKMSMEWTNKVESVWTHFMTLLYRLLHVLEEVNTNLRTVFFPKWSFTPITWIYLYTCYISGSIISVQNYRANLHFPENATEDLNGQSFVSRWGLQICFYSHVVLIHWKHRLLKCQWMGYSLSLSQIVSTEVIQWTRTLDKTSCQHFRTCLSQLEALIFRGANSNKRESRHLFAWLLQIHSKKSWTSLE